MKRLLLATTAALAAGSLLQPKAVAAADQAAQVEEVVVTATRLSGPLDESPGVRVIDAEQIERSGAVFAAEVLDTVPGLSVFSNGAFGGVASVRMRGAASDKTLVLVDGAPLNDPSQPSGGFDLGGFDLADVERIEILSGPQGALWGSDAIGGVIAFTTRETDGVRAAAEAGSFGTVRGSLAAGLARERYALGFSAAGLTTDGISKADAADGNAEADGFDNRTLGLHGRFDPAERVRLDARLRWNAYRAEVDAYPGGVLGDAPDVADSESWSALVRAGFDGLAGFDHLLSASLYRLDRSQSGGEFPFRYTADREVWRWTAERRRARWGLALGVEREDVRADLSTGEGDQGVSSAFAVLRLRPASRLTATASLRRDDPDGHAPETTARAAAVLELGRGWSVEASWGQGFKIPTISQSLCDFCFPPAPADLRPERAEGWDLGLAWTSADGRASAAVTAYALEVRDQIDFVFDPVTFASTYANIDRTRTRGLEAEAAVELSDNLSLSGAYGYTDAQDAATGAALLRTPLHAGSVALDWSGERLRASLTVRGESEQADTGRAFEPVTREGFVVADLNAGWRVDARAELTLRVRNLADARHQQAFGYGEPGRSAYVGVRLRY